MRSIAERLIAYEAKEGISSGTEATTIFPVSLKLRAPLAALLGNTGFDALMSRALMLASPEVAWLRLLQVGADGSLVGPIDLHTQVSPSKIVAGRVALLARLLELLEAFIGKGLTIQMVSELWPTLALD
jgi:hypothetical protein